VCEFFQADGRHVFEQKLRAARDMGQRVFGTELVLAIGTLAQITEIMKQRGDHTDGEQFGGQRLLVAGLTLIAVEQPRHRQRDIENVLNIVILGVAGVIVRMFAVVILRQVIESAFQRAGMALGEQATEQAYDLITDVDGVGSANLVGNVEIAASHG
jgi:hypothetical protein